MIYFYDKNGKVANVYSYLSGIDYVLEYTCSGRIDGLVKLNNEERKVYVACPDWQYALNWMEKNDYMADTIDNGRIRHESSPAILSGDSVFSWYIRGSHKINWNQDYHFYYN